MMAIRTTHQQRIRGFTLIELLVAIVIFAIVGVLAMGGFNQLIGQSEHTRKNMARVRSLQKAVLRMTQDFAELEPRSIREALGGQLQPCLLAETGSTFIAQLTRAGWSNPAGIQRPTLQRVGYRMDNDKLVRDYWPVLDRAQAVTPISQTLIEGVASVKLRFMDERFAWQDHWPAINNAVQSTVSVNGNNSNNNNNNNNNNSNNPASALLGEQRPLAVEITIELQDWGKIVRLVEVPG